MIRIISALAATLAVLLASWCILWNLSNTRHSEATSFSSKLPDRMRDGVIGIEVVHSGPFPSIAAVVVGSPAELSNRLEPGMLLIGVAEGGSNAPIFSTRNKSSDELSEMLDGADSSHVALEVVSVNEGGLIETDVVEVQRAPLRSCDWGAQPRITKVVHRVEYDTNLLYQVFGASGEFEEFFRPDFRNAKTPEQFLRRIH